jgi:hypothetical protein
MEHRWTGLGFAPYSQRDVDDLLTLTVSAPSNETLLLHLQTVVCLSCDLELEEAPEECSPPPELAAHRWVAMTRVPMTTDELRAWEETGDPRPFQDMPIVHGVMCALCGMTPREVVAAEEAGEDAGMDWCETRALWSWDDLQDP